MIYRGICGMCRHLHDTDDESAEFDPPNTCDAFPHGIPPEINVAGFDHRGEFPGDNGIRFEPDGPVDVARIDRIVRRAQEAKDAFAD